MAKAKSLAKGAKDSEATIGFQSPALRGIKAYFAPDRIHANLRQPRTLATPRDPDASGLPKLQSEELSIATMNA